MSALVVPAAGAATVHTHHSTGTATVHSTAPQHARHVLRHCHRFHRHPSCRPHHRWWHHDRYDQDWNDDGRRAGGWSDDGPRDRSRPGSMGDPGGMGNPGGTTNPGGTSNPGGTTSGTHGSGGTSGGTGSYCQSHPSACHH